MFSNISHINWYMAKVGNMQKMIADVKAELFGLTCDLRVDGIHRSTIGWHVREMIVWVWQVCSPTWQPQNSLWCWDRKSIKSHTFSCWTSIGKFCISGWHISRWKISSTTLLTCKSIANALTLHCGLHRLLSVLSRWTVCKQQCRQTWFV